MLPTMYESLRNTLFHLALPFLKEIIFYMYFFSLASYHSLYFWGVSMLTFVGIVRSFLLPLVIYSLFCWWIFGFYSFVFMSIASVTSLVSIHVSWYVLGHISCIFSFFRESISSGICTPRSSGREIWYFISMPVLGIVRYYIFWRSGVYDMVFSVCIFLTTLMKLHIFSYTYRLFILALLWDAY